MTKGQKRRAKEKKKVEAIRLEPRRLERRDLRNWLAAEIAYYTELANNIRWQPWDEELFEQVG